MFHSESVYATQLPIFFLIFWLTFIFRRFRHHPSSNSRSRIFRSDFTKRWTVRYNWKHALQIRMLEEDDDDGFELERLIYQLGRDLPPRPDFSREFCQFPVNWKTFLSTSTTSITGSRCLSSSSESLYKSDAATSCVPICQSIFLCLQSTQLSLKTKFCTFCYFKY